MLSLDDRFELLQADLLADPPKISTYADLPFAILRYEPEKEWDLRRKLRLLIAAIEARGKRVRVLSLADLLWQAVDQTEGMDAIVAEERGFGYPRAEETLNRILSDSDFAPLPDLLAEKLAGLDPRRDIAFLLRAGAMAPGIYHMSKLLDEMHGRTRVPTILCYPGTQDGVTGLIFMGMRGREAMGNYRVKIYG